MNLSFLLNMNDDLLEIMRITKKVQDDVGYETPVWTCVNSPGNRLIFQNYLPLSSQHQKIALQRFSQNIGVLARDFVASFPYPERVSLYIAINADHSFTLAFDERFNGVLTNNVHINRYALSDVFEVLTTLKKETA